MSSTRPAPLRIDCPPLVQVTVQQPAGRTLAQRMGNLAIDVPVGLYTLELRTADVVTSKLVHVPHWGHAENIQPMTFRTVTPLNHTTPAHAEHQHAAAYWSRYSTAGAAEKQPTLAILVFPHSAPPDGDRPRDWQVTDGSGRPLETEAWTTGGQDDARWAAWSQPLPAGPYRLEWRRDAATLALALWVERGWTTLVFLSEGPHGLDPSHASVHTIPRGDTWAPDDQSALAQEVALAGLRQNRCLVSEETLDRMLGDDTFNPVQALVYAHALQLPGPLTNDRKRKDLLQALTGQLHRRTPRHPDVAALRVTAAGRPDGPAVGHPPLLAASCTNLLSQDAQASVDSPIQPGSPAEYALSRRVDTGLWTTWLRQAGPSYWDPPVPVDKVLAFVRQVATVNDITITEAVQQLGEAEIARRTQVPRRFVPQAVERLRAPRRSVYHASNSILPGRKVWAEGDNPTKDATVNRAYAALGATFELYLKAFGRNSLDDNGLPLIATVHSGTAYNNAFWNGEQMIYGDGDGEIFLDFTIPLDVTAHELTHGVVQYTANLSFFGQPGALHESICDVFGSLVKQYALGQSAAEADWLIGAGLFTPRITGTALRSMKAPGTAYDDDILGKDPQPATMDDYVRTGRDDGGVHINSGIPNHAFYLLATALGGYAWQRAGQIWYDVLTGGELTQGALFADFAKLTVAAARARYSEGEELQAVYKAWEQVGVRTS